VPLLRPSAVSVRAAFVLTPPLRIGDFAVRLPIRLVSVANLREHWAAKAKRTAAQRKHVRLAMLSMLGPWKGGWRQCATLTRIAPRTLDYDGLVSGCKATVDGIADYLGIDDRHLAVTYAQRKGEPREYGVEIAIHVAKEKVA